MSQIGRKWLDDGIIDSTKLGLDAFYNPTNAGSGDGTHFIPHANNVVFRSGDASMIGNLNLGGYKVTGTATTVSDPNYPSSPSDLVNVQFFTDNASTFAWKQEVSTEVVRNSTYGYGNDTTKFPGTQAPLGPQDGWMVWVQSTDLIYAFVDNTGGPGGYWVKAGQTPSVPYATDQTAGKVFLAPNNSWSKFVDSTAGTVSGVLRNDDSRIWHWDGANKWGITGDATVGGDTILNGDLTMYNTGNDSTLSVFGDGWRRMVITGPGQTDLKVIAENDLNLDASNNLKVSSAYDLSFSGNQITMISGAGQARVDATPLTVRGALHVTETPIIGTSSLSVFEGTAGFVLTMDGEPVKFSSGGNKIEVNNGDGLFLSTSASNVDVTSSSGDIMVTSGTTGHGLYLNPNSLGDYLKIGTGNGRTQIDVNGITMGSSTKLAVQGNVTMCGDTTTADVYIPSGNKFFVSTGNNKTQIDVNGITMGSSTKLAVQGNASFCGDATFSTSGRIAGRMDVYGDLYICGSAAATTTLSLCGSVIAAGVTLVYKQGVLISVS